MLFKEHPPQYVFLKNIDTHRRKKGTPLSLIFGEAELSRVDSHVFESLALWFFAELNDLTLRISLQQPELGGFFGARGCHRNGNVGVRLEMLRDEWSIIHAIQMIARQDKNRFTLVVIKVMKALAHGVRSSLKPVWPFGSYFGSEYLYKAISKTAEAIG